MEADHLRSPLSLAAPRVIDTKKLESLALDEGSSIRCPPSFWNTWSRILVIQAKSYKCPLPCYIILVIVVTNQLHKFILGHLPSHVREEVKHIIHHYNQLGFSYSYRSVRVHGGRHGNQTTPFTTIWRGSVLAKSLAPKGKEDGWLIPWSTVKASSGLAPHYTHFNSHETHPVISNVKVILLGYIDVSTHNQIPRTARDAPHRHNHSFPPESTPKPRSQALYIWPLLWERLKKKLLPIMATVTYYLSPIFSLSPKTHEYIAIKGMLLTKAFPISYKIPIKQKHWLMVLIFHHSISALLYNSEQNINFLFNDA